MEIGGSTLYISHTFTPFHELVSAQEDKKAERIAQFIQQHGYKGDEMLMNPNTGIVSSAVDFAIEILTSYEDNSPPSEEIGSQIDFAYFLKERATTHFLSLVRVEKSEDNEWVESE